MDERMTKKWIKKVWLQYLKRTSASNKSILIWDNFASHVETREWIEKNRSTVFSFPKAALVYYNHWM
jgi:hypothetical protein